MEEISQPIPNTLLQTKTYPKYQFTGRHKERCTGEVPVGLKPYPNLFHNMKIIARNARGIATPSFRRNFLFLVHTYRPHMFILTQTRVSKTNTEKIMEGLPFENWVLMELKGFDGGVLILWNSLVEFEVVTQNKKWIHGIIQVKSNPSSKFFLSGIYGSPKLHIRRGLWEDLRAIASKM